MKTFTCLLFLLLFYNDLQAQTWSEALKAVAADRAVNDEFGWSVGISGNYAVAGASQRRRKCHRKCNKS